MTREQAKAALPIIQAFADKKLVQERIFSDDDIWEWKGVCVLAVSTLQEHPDRFRIKPQPREFWMSREFNSDGQSGQWRITDKPPLPTDFREVIAVKEVL